MRAACLLALSLLGSSLPLIAHAGDIPGSDFASGNWSGRAWQDDAGNFTDCYFGVGYGNGENLSVSLAADDTLTLYFSAPGASFAPQAVYDATLLTEVGWPVVGQAIGSNETYVGFTLAGIDQTIDYLTQGAYLRLLGVGIDQSFDVRGLGGALALARACHTTFTTGAKTAAAAPAPAAEPAAPAKPVLGRSGDAAKPVQMSGGVSVFKRQHLP
ncbi:MAG: hypothetical protein KBF78_01600 [Fuscovulum sp.]|nr:hypothetical protein [Fuscovulum sp.]